MAFVRIVWMAWLTTMGSALAVPHQQGRQHHHHHRSKTHLPNVFAVHMHESVPCQQEIGAALEAAGCDVVFRTNVQTKLASMCSFEIKNNSCDHSSAIIANVPGHLKTAPVSRIHRPMPVETLATTRTTTTTSSSSSSTTTFDPRTEAIHKSTGVLDARYKLGLTGDGIKVAIIDTGVYYLHPALGGGFGPGFKVAFGYDLVGDKYNGTTSDTIVPDHDPMDNCSDESHGTLVAGIVAANATHINAPGFVPPIPFTGVAPGVTLGAYRVFGCTGTTADDITAAAILRAAEDGADIINLSLGSRDFASMSVDAMTAQIVSNAGHIVVAAIGNDGSAGAYTTSAPGLSEGSLGIASFDNVLAYSGALRVDGILHAFTLGYNGNFIFDVPLAASIVVNNPNAVADHVLDDGCATIDVDVRGKAILLYWKEPHACNSTIPCDNAAAAGAVACIVYYQADVLFKHIEGSKNIPSLITTLSAGQAIIADLATNKTPIVVPTKHLVDFPDPGGEILSDFSSIGLTNELLLKPDLGGIGANVLSTISTYAAHLYGLPTPYGTNSGTSLASPYVAGCVALLLQKRGKLGFDAARAYLQNTATPTNMYNSSLIYSPAYQGAGLVNIYKAAMAKTLVTPSSLSLNDTANQKRHQVIRITNEYDVNVGPITYYLLHEPAATANTFNSGDDFLLDEVTTTFDTKYVATISFARMTGKGSGKLSNTIKAGFRKKGGDEKSAHAGKHKGGKKEGSRKGNEREGSIQKRLWARRLGSRWFSVTVKPRASATIRLHITAPVPASSDLWPLFGGYIVISNSIDDQIIRVPYAGVAGIWKDRDIWARNSTSLYSRWGLENPFGPQGLFGAKPSSVGTGLYADSKFKPLNRLDVVNVSDALVLAIAASDTRSANITITDLCSSDAALHAMGLQRTSFLSLLDLTAFYRDNVPLTDLPQSGELFRNTYADDSFASDVTAPHIYGINGTTFTDANFITSFVLPEGIYQVNFVARKNFVNGEEVDVVSTPPFQLVYRSPLSANILADCKI